ncbi:endonuclease/exonuclease/phosphatase family protein [Prevotella pectinovora]|uniref:endonuclease/exonuclease/phosphatase family protein n=1 Tax=Prevotella pectinovora TaxID=1602169 RepID=UPI002591C7F6|nr:endonuclease/exonuclease/phosphatase family protein [uncultured Prevotella sp.]
MDKVKKFTMHMLAAASAVTVCVMLAVGYSYKLNPVEHPLFANVGLVFPIFLLINGGFLVLFLLTWKRLTLIPLAGYVLCYIPAHFYSPLNMLHSTPDGAIKVMSYNVYMFHNGDSASIQKIADYVNDSGASIVCMQEAAFSDVIRDAFKKEYEYIDTMRNGMNGEVQIVLSKFPILSKTRINPELSGCMCGAYEVLIDGDRTTVINCHFETSGLTLEERSEFRNIVKGDWENRSVRQDSKRMIVRLGEAAKRRVPQVEGVIRYIESRKGEPVLLFGDFNDTPISYCHHLLARTLTDCYVTTANGPGISYHYNRIYVRIDNVMCSNDWHPYNFTVDRSINVSDHYPLWGFVKKSLHNDKKTH